jgi:D-galacturonate reductase
MKYVPNNGKFVGQNGYGYKSFEVFIRACNDIKEGRCKPGDFDADLATVRSNLLLG